MLHDALEIADGTVLEADLAIVGAGPAGITLARAVAGRGRRVLLLEGGGREYEADSQDLYAGTNVGLPYYELEAARLRMLGGTTNHWTGRSVPLDANVFEHRDWVPHSGWPFGLDELLPYYQRAQEVLKLGPFVYQPEPAARLPLDPAVIRHGFRQIHQFSFGEAYGPELAAADQIDLVLHANVTDIQAHADLRRVERLAIRTLDGRRLSARARAFALACGGLETARLLLASNRQAPAGLGNQNDVVGRYFMEHLDADSGVFLPSDPNWSLGIYDRYVRHRNEEEAGE